MSSNPGLSGHSKAAPFQSGYISNKSVGRNREREASAQHIVTVIDEALHHRPRPLSKWSASFNKRLFDIACVLFSLPIALPVFLLTGLAVRLTSRGPVLFRQKRMGCDGHSFTIYKFRTMPVRRHTTNRPNVTTANNQRFTPVGPFLRRWKLDELPQLFNVLCGDMSLVGPRPKLPTHQSCRLICRPGITGRATIVFAREEVTLASIPVAQLDTYYHGVVLPLKQLLDEEYMAKATFASDLKLIVHSVLRKWDELQLSDLPVPPQYLVQSRATVESIDRAHVPVVRATASASMATHLQAD